MIKKNRLENVLAFIIPSVIIIVMAIYFLNVRNRARGYEDVLIISIFYLSIVAYALIIIEEYTKYLKNLNREQLFTKNQAFLVIATILFIPLQMILGFVLSSFIYALAVQTKLGVKKWTTKLFVALILSVGLWFIFNGLLKSRLPLGIFKYWEVFSR